MKLWVVTIEETYSCDVVVLAPNSSDARDGESDGTHGSVQREVVAAGDLPTGMTVDDDVDAVHLDAAGGRIRDFLEDEEVRATRLHNETMQALQGRLF